MSLNVLIVDDSAPVRKILYRVMIHADLPLGTVLEAGDGKEALEIIKDVAIHLVLSDICMPNMDGLQLLRELKSMDEYKRVPVLMITTEGSQSVAMEAAGLGAVGFVRKPFTAEQIKEKLQGVL